MPTQISPKSLDPGQDLPPQCELMDVFSLWFEVSACMYISVAFDNGVSWLKWCSVKIGYIPHVLFLPLCPYNIDEWLTNVWFLSATEKFDNGLCLKFFPHVCFYCAGDCWYQLYVSGVTGRVCGFGSAPGTTTWNDCLFLLCRWLLISAVSLRSHWPCVRVR